MFSMFCRTCFLIVFCFLITAAQSKNKKYKMLRFAYSHPRMGDGGTYLVISVGR